MRWALLAVWLGLAAVLASAILHMDSIATAAPGCPGTPTSYPPPPTHTPRATVVFTTKYKTYAPLVNQQAGGWPAGPVTSVVADPLAGLRIRWEPLPDALYYLVHEAANRDMSCQREIGRVQAQQTLEVAVASPPTGGVYYRVTAVSRQGATVGEAVAVSIPAAPRLSIAEQPGGGYAVVWSQTAGAMTYRLFESLSSNMANASQVWSGASALQVGDMSFVSGPRKRADYYYRLAVSTSQVTVLSEVLRVPVPRPGLAGIVTYGGQAIEGALVELWRCDGDASRCVTGREAVDATMTQADGSYSFTQVQRTPAGKALYVLFDNPRDNRDYLNFWRGPNIVGYNGVDTLANAAHFDIANVFLEEPAPNATVVNPATFRWLRRGILTDDYRLTFMDMSGQPLGLGGRLGYVSTVRYDVEGALAFGRPYLWNVWVYGPDGGYGESFYYRQVTFLRGRVKDDTALPLAPLKASDAAAEATTWPPERESGLPTLER